MPGDDDRHEYDDLLNEIEARVEGLPQAQSERALLAEVTEVIEERLPDIRCLDGVRNCIEARCKLFGLPVPPTKETEHPDETTHKPDVHRTREETARLMLEVLDTVRAEQGTEKSHD